MLQSQGYQGVVSVCFVSHLSSIHDGQPLCTKAHMSLLLYACSSSEILVSELDGVAKSQATQFFQTYFAARCASYVNFQRCQSGKHREPR